MLASYGAGQPSNAKGQIMSSTKGKILVVEDEALIAMSIEFALQELGFETMVASNLEAAHAHLAMSDIRLAVLDYKLRDGKTTGIAEALRAQRIPFVVCSGSQFNDIASVFEGAPILSKPFTDDHLSSAVLGALGGN
jgi:DNA-binding response OmpR family regulator